MSLDNGMDDIAPPPAPMSEATPIRADALRSAEYFPDDGLVTAVNLAWQLEMPLLLTGEPGTGKTVFASAVAEVLGFGRPLRCDVRSDSTARDLLYQHDAVARFADAQGEQKARAADARHYVRLEGLGEALAWTGDHRPVLLVDEIDKAPRDLPNDLLRELDEGWFRIPEIQSDKANERLQPVMGHRDGSGHKPLVIITSNAERQLPDPFLRRCVFHHLEFPKAGRLMEIVLTKAFPPTHDPGETERRQALATRAVKLFESLRDENRIQMVKPPATSELVQWVAALHRMYRHPVVVTRLDDVNGAVARAGPVPWGSLPALQCLVKLRDDLQLLGRRAPGG